MGQEEGFCHISNEALPVMQHIPPPEQVISLASRPVSQVDLTLYLRYDATDSLNAAAASRSCCSLTHFSFQNLRAHLFIDSQKPPPFFFFRRRRCCVRGEKEKIIG